MKEFGHDYYFHPHKQGEQSTVLCMRCALKIKGPDVSKEQSNLLYREKDILWIEDNGIKTKGVVILCPTCVDLEITEEHLSLINRQVTKAFEDEAKWVKSPFRLTPEVWAKMRPTLKTPNQEAA